MPSSHAADPHAIPAARSLLANLGWRYLSQEQTLALRNGRADQAILTGILQPWLESNNRFLAKGKRHRFSDTNINEAIRRLSEEPYTGLARTNEQIYHLLTLGISLEQTVRGERKGRTLQFIDWRHPQRNQFHITDAFPVERTRSSQRRHPDMVLFVNGIPFVVIGYPPSDQQLGIDAAIDALNDAQRDNEIPKLFQYAQLLLASTVNEVRYGSVKTAKTFWSRWREEAASPSDMQAAISTPHPTAQDATFWALLRPQRLLSLIYGYTVFDAGVRKIARYQQYFAVTATLDTVKQIRNGKRAGGVVWHTTGSGKTLTMVMLAKALALQPDIKAPRIVLVTDRIDLDKQLADTFNACGKHVARATTGEHLLRLINEGNVSLITTVINKFATLTGKHSDEVDNPNIFVIVDESHRSNYGIVANQMRRIFANACYIGFTGTPLLKTEKSTAKKFGGFIHRYPMRQAVDDSAVVPLIYEGRIALTKQNDQAMQAWFEHITQHLPPQRKTKLKRLLARDAALHQTTKRIHAIALDICTHYLENFQNTGLKAQLATDSRQSALLYRRVIQDAALISCEVIMSQPCADNGDNTGETATAQQFWREMMQRHGSEEKYNEDILAAFSRADGIELLIVVDKLLTGFDEPRNTVLYIDKPLKDHNLLQAIARVNRLHSDKTYGYIVDYRGVLGHLNTTLNRYDALTDFDAGDVDLTGVLTDSHETITELSRAHRALSSLFDDVTPRHDAESRERHLAPAHRRKQFHDALRRFQNLLAAALATAHFHEQTPAAQINAYLHDLKQFRALRAGIQRRYGETLDHESHEIQIRKVMNSHILSPDVDIVSATVDIFDAEAFDREVQRHPSRGAQGDMIANRSIAAIQQHLEEDPVFYRQFADCLQQAMDDYHQGRIDENHYLKRTQHYLNELRLGHDPNLPPKLTGHRDAQAYCGVINAILSRQAGGQWTTGEPSPPAYGDDAAVKTHPRAADMALTIADLIAERQIRDWQHSEDVINLMENDIDDYLYQFSQQHKLALTTKAMDDIIERCLRIARARAPR